MNRLGVKKTTCIYGHFYDCFIGTFLKSMRSRVALYIKEHGLFPVLDLCCGTGTQCSIISQSGSNVFGIDHDCGILHYAALHYPNLPFVCADAGSLPFKSAFFRSLIISYSLHEKTPAMRQKMIKEVLRVLKPESKIIFIDYETPWNFSSRIGRVFTFIIEKMAGKEHFRNCQQFLNWGGLRDFVQRSRLKELESIPIALGNSRILIAKK